MEGSAHPLGIEVGAVRAALGLVQNVAVSVETTPVSRSRAALGARASMFAMWCRVVVLWCFEPDASGFSLSQGRQLLPVQPHLPMGDSGRWRGT